MWEIMLSVALEMKHKRVDGERKPRQYVSIWGTEYCTGKMYTGGHHIQTSVRQWYFLLLWIWP